MTKGQKSNAVRMHNRRMMPVEIADALDLPTNVVVAFLKGRKGWPGRITSSTAVATTITDEGERLMPVKRQVPSLPKLKFMGEV